MAKKHFSVILVPHTKTSIRTLSLSKRSIKTAIAGAGVAVLLLIAVLVDYVALNGLRAKYRALERETAGQREKIAGYETSVQRLTAQIARFEEFAQRLNVMAGLKSPVVMDSLPGLGGGEEAADPGAAAASGPNAPAGSLGTIQSLSVKALSVENNLGSLVNFWEGHGLELASTPSIKPAQGYIASTWGYRSDPFTGLRTFHYGMDISTNTGNPVVATADGTVIRVAQDKFLGKHVIVNHGFGYTTVYAHLSEFKSRNGQRVKRGDLLGLVGMTGKAVGPHVHYEVRLDGKPVNPWNFLLEE